MILIVLALTHAFHSAAVQTPAASSVGHVIEATGLRGTPASRVQTASASHLPPRRSIVALQTSAMTRSEAHKSKRMASKKSRRMASKLRRRARRQQMMTRREVRHEENSGGCRGRKLLWWIKIKKKCHKAYGKDSKWDRNKSPECGTGWRNCNTGYYAVCCSQPKGAKSMDAYCDKLVMGNGTKKEDKACEVQGLMSDVGQDMKSIKDAVIQLNVNLPAAPAPTPASLPFYMAPAPALVPAIRASSPAMAPVLTVPAATTPLPKTPVLGIAHGKTSFFRPHAPAPAAGDALAPVFPVAGVGTAPKDSLQDRCDKLIALTKQAAKRIDEIRSWSKQDGVEPKPGENTEVVDTESLEAKDPDLVWSVKGVLKAGDQLNDLMATHKFCGAGSNEDYDDEEDDEEEEEEDDIKADLKRDPASDWKDEDEDDEDEDDEPDINTTALLELLEWEDSMTKAVDFFENEVHPYGMKWWRYRYEYCVIESFVFAYSVLLLWILQRLLGGHFFQKLKFYKTGQPVKLYRYAYIYFMFRAGCVCVMVFLAYMLYTPWGPHNIFDIFAKVFLNAVDGQFNVPYMGYSWLSMVLDVQFQMFATFCLYALFLVFVAHHYTRALEDWKAMSEGGNASSAANERLYTKVESVIQRRVRIAPKYLVYFIENKVRLKGVPQLEGDPRQSDWVDFKLHLYLTDVCGKSMEALVEVSLTSYMIWAACALFVALLAHVFQLAFMFFLPLLFVVAILIVVSGYFVSEHFLSLAENEDHDDIASFVTVRSYCRAFQSIMYCLFYSFARLLLSFDIFTNYPKVYISALIGLVCILGLLAASAGEMIKAATCAVSLIPHIPPEQFKRHLEHIVSWHKTIKCHETGILQLPMDVAYCTEWAGRHDHKDYDEGEKSTPGSLFSFR